MCTFINILLRPEDPPGFNIQIHALFISTLRSFSAYCMERVMFTCRLSQCGNPAMLCRPSQTTTQTTTPTTIPTTTPTATLITILTTTQTIILTPTPITTPTMTTAARPLLSTSTTSRGRWLSAPLPPHPSPPCLPTRRCPPRPPLRTRTCPPHVGTTATPVSGRETKRGGRTTLLS